MQQLRIVALIVIASVLLLGVHGQTFFATGQVTAVNTTSIALNGELFPFAVTCKVVVQTKRNEAFFEDNASLHNIIAGNHVTIHVNGNVVDQVIIERWRQ